MHSPDSIQLVTFVVNNAAVIVATVFKYLNEMLVLLTDSCKTYKCFFINFISLIHIWLSKVGTITSAENPLNYEHITLRTVPKVIISLAVIRLYFRINDFYLIIMQQTLLGQKLTAILSQRYMIILIPDQSVNKTL